MLEISSQAETALDEAKEKESGGKAAAESSMSMSIWASKWTELTNPPPESWTSHFSLIGRQKHAAVALSHDKGLVRMRYKLVPSRIRYTIYSRMLCFLCSLLLTTCPLFYVQLSLSPNDGSEETFWSAYFYAVECIHQVEKEWSTNESESSNNNTTAVKTDIKNRNDANSISATVEENDTLRGENEKLQRENAALKQKISDLTLSRQGDAANVVNTEEDDTANVV